MSSRLQPRSGPGLATTSRGSDHLNVEPPLVPEQPGGNRRRDREPLLNRSHHARHLPAVAYPGQASSSTMTVAARSPITDTTIPLTLYARLASAAGTENPRGSTQMSRRAT